MRIQIDKKRTFGVLGLPHSGTTIACNLFNSMENAFCLSEPHWTLLTGPKHLRFDKLGKLGHKSIDDVWSAVQRKLQTTDFMYGGVKETYRSKNERMQKYLDLIVNQSDDLYVVFRDPRALFSSLKKMAAQSKLNPMPFQYLARDYLGLYRAAQKVKSKVRVLILEDICQAGDDGITDYLTKHSGLNIEGDFVLKPTDYKYGNPKANKSRSLIKPNMVQDMLTTADLKDIEQELLPTYRSLRKTHQV